MSKTLMMWGSEINLMKYKQSAVHSVRKKHKEQWFFSGFGIVNKF